MAGIGLQHKQAITAVFLVMADPPLLMCAATTDKVMLVSCMPAVKAKAWIEIRLSRFLALKERVNIEERALGCSWGFQQIVWLEAELFTCLDLCLLVVWQKTSPPEDPA